MLALVDCKEREECLSFHPNGQEFSYRQSPNDLLIPPVKHTKHVGMFRNDLGGLIPMQMLFNTPEDLHRYYSTGGKPVAVATLIWEE